MLRQYFLPYSADPRPAPSLGDAWAARNLWKFAASRSWTLDLVDHVAGRHRQVSRLKAAVQTDMVGYSRLFGLDNTGTITRWRDLRRRLIAPVIRHHHGKLAQTAGDSMLIMFDSITQAVKCAVTIQSELASENTLWPADRRMDLRIGVDFGDVIEEGTNFHGDGVIIAARLQAICPAGGVCISRAVHDKAGDRLNLPHDICRAPALS